MGAGAIPLGVVPLAPPVMAVLELGGAPDWPDPPEHGDLPLRSKDINPLTDMNNQQRVLSHEPAWKQRGEIEKNKT